MDFSSNLQIKPKNQTNICTLFQSSQIHGTGIQKLPRKYLELVATDNSEQHKLKKKASAFVLDLMSFREKQHEFDDKLFTAMLDRMLEYFDSCPSSTECCPYFNTFGGNQILVEILELSIYHDNTNNVEIINPVPEKLLRNLKTILQILNNMQSMLCCFQSNISLQNFLFSLLAEKRQNLYQVAAKVLLEINASDLCNAVLQLKKISCLKALLTSPLNSSQKLCICSVFSGLLSAVDFIANFSDNLFRYDRWLLDNIHIKHNQENHHLLATIPEFIKLVIDAACKVLTTEDFNSLNFPDLRSILNIDIEGEVLENPFQDNPRIAPWYELVLLKEKSSRPHSFVILSLMLMGKAKQKIHEDCVAYNLIPKLKKIVDPLVWSTFQHISHFSNEGEEIPNAERPDVFFKIQYLRLLHTIGDHCDNKYYLLSRSELQEIKGIAKEFLYDIPQLNTIDENKCCDVKCGLLLDVLRRLTNEPYNSHIRFWMARSLESFLRGQPCLVDQMLLIRRNLVENLISYFLTEDALSSDVIQCQFDLLASVMKNCVYAFERLNKEIDCSEKFKKLRNIIDFNLVDSNMFVRCIILTLHFLTRNQENLSFIGRCRILQHFSQFETRVNSICNLVKILNVKKLTQENISCLNTTITYLIIAKCNNELPLYLKAINEWYVGEFKQGVLHNLKVLLSFWIDHYSLPSRESDCKQLEETTGIPMKHWTETVNLLLDQSNNMSPLSIAYYIKLNSNIVPFNVNTPHCSRIS